MKYSELIQHCANCKNFAQANNLQLNSKYMEMSVVVSVDEMREILDDLQSGSVLPFAENIDPTKKMEILGVTVMPSVVANANHRYLLRQNKQYLLLKDIQLKTESKTENALTVVKY